MPPQSVAFDHLVVNDELALGRTRNIAFRRKERVARDTYAFVFEKPVGLMFEAGQAVELTLLDPPHRDGRGVRRSFSIVSAPYEHDLVVATRIRDSAFKHGLQTLQPGAHVAIGDPFGSLVLHGNPSRPAVLIAGGIGITPFVSMLRQAAHDRREQVLTLLYSNRRPDDAAFLTELSNYEREHRGFFRLRATVTEALPHGALWHGDRARINAAFVNSVIVPPSAPVFYVAGPPAMVSAIRQMLASIGTHDDDIRAEEFSGY